MHVKVHPLRVKGRNLHHDELKTAPPYSGMLTVSEVRDYDLSRPVVCARLLDITMGTETNVLPELSDARILWAQERTMRFTGFERIDNVDYAQTWTVVVL